MGYNISRIYAESLKESEVPLSGKANFINTAFMGGSKPVFPITCGGKDFVLNLKIQDRELFKNTKWGASFFLFLNCWGYFLY